MDIKPLQTFLVAARLLGFGEAARALNYSQSTVSEHIRLLEEELGVRLFERIGRQVFLTEQGRLLVPLAEKLKQDLSMITGAFRQDESFSGTLTIGSVESLCVFWLPQLLKEYKLRYPRVRVVIRIIECAQMAAWIRQNKVDVAFGMSDESRQPNILQQLLFKGEAYFVAAPDHELADRTGITLDELANQTIIAPELSVAAGSGGSYRQKMDDLLVAAGVQPLSLMEFDSMEAIRQCVKHGLGIGLMPDLAVRDDLYNGTLVRIKCQMASIPYEAFMLLHREKWLAPPLSALANMVREKVISTI